ncbi:hypothetical protein GCM10016272_25710 [Psychrobacter glaciei]|uniref:Integrase n=1 Tax=Psychrobacter glaciei TaxID=619771 RepID=A0ABQ3GX21_9GAMM|nr:hypothetical protein [Psychrobacter glaciei]GHD37524.1 hypothetical protein GCM10016272_25710 [Psychrobacter glaciei]
MLDLNDLKPKPTQRFSKHRSIIIKMRFSGGLKEDIQCIKVLTLTGIVRILHAIDIFNLSKH